MRPSVCAPTGTLIGAPVSPRHAADQAVGGCMAMQRTRFSPRCWATSTVMLIGSGPSPGW
jgi:hypothetical protein